MSAQHSHARLVVVDDDPDLLAALCAMLRKQGFDVVGLTDSASALAALQPGSCDVLLSDLVLPGLSGIQLLQQAIKVDPDLVGVIMTAQGSIEVAVEAMHSGAFDFVVKPFRLAHVLAVLERALAFRRVRAENARLKREVEQLQAERLRLLEEANVRLEALATTDPLTGLANRRAFDAALAREIALARRGARALSLVLLDVDHFKGYNDRFGHPAGDLVLQEVAAAIRACSRETDVAARLGGDEFAVLLPQGSAEGVRTMAERIRAKVADAPVLRGSVTVSVGVATTGAEATNVAAGDQLVAAADRSLYRAKSSGRNQVARPDECPGRGLVG